MRGWKGAWAALFVCSWAGNQFTPLLLMYKQLDGYSTVTVNSFLGVYVLGLGPSLVLAGPLSDRYGRRRLMQVGAVAALATSVVLGLGVWGPAPIYLGRLLAGIAVGTATAVGTSWLKELSQGPYDPGADPGDGARRASVAFSLGSGIGALVAGVLAQWAPLPQVLPYLVHALVAVPVVFLVRYIPETTRPGGAPFVPLRRAIRTSSTRHPRFTGVVVYAAPWIFAIAALAYGYAPVLLRDHIHHDSIAYATLLTVVALMVSAFIQPVAKRLDDVDTARGLFAAMLIMTVSVAGVGLVSWSGSPLLGVLTAALSGAGMGIGLSTGLLEVQRIASPDHLAGLTGLFYAVAYLGFLTPTVASALGPLVSTGQVFLGLTVLAIACTTVVLARSRAHLPHLSAHQHGPRVHR